MVTWVFSYGSLVWNPGFEFDERIVGFIKDYRRVFDLSCIDHRGTPENPARTLTLEAKKGEICWALHIVLKVGIIRNLKQWSIWREENANMTRKYLLTRKEIRLGQW